MLHTKFRGNRPASFGEEDFERFLAHLSQRQKSERPSVVICRRPQFQTSSSQKPHAQSKPNFMWSLLGYGERKFVRGIWVT